MKIEIVTPYQYVVNDEAEEVYAVGPKGEFGVLPGHVHYITPLATGRLYYRRAGKRFAFVVQGGFLEVFAEKVIVMADQVEKAEALDLAKSKQSLEKLDKQLGQDNLEPEQFEALVRQRIAEQARVQVASEAA